MALPINAEAILSDDDYEEGEILEDDTLYEDVSSLEEFSCEEEAVIVDLTRESDPFLMKNHRRKEHKCKEDSICRKERKAKHCFARIRKEKLTMAPKPKDVKEVDTYISDRVVSRRLDVPSRRTEDRHKHPSPQGRSRADNSRPHRFDHKGLPSRDNEAIGFESPWRISKLVRRIGFSSPCILELDHHEKENRISNRRHWNNNEKSSRSRLKPPEKYSSSYSRSSKDYKSKPPGCVLSSHRNHDDRPPPDPGKTSLLKRLVGSGSTGVKSYSETETPSLEPSNGVVSSNDPPTALPETETKIEQASSEALSSQETLTKNENAVDPPTETKKTFGMVWKRSMKDDKDELTLRVEALKSAWIRKFSERRKKGLLNHKKTNSVDDSLVDIILSSDEDVLGHNEEVTSDISKSTQIIQSSDFSGDILKPIDMDIDVNEMSSEPVLQIETHNESGLFVPSVLDLPDSGMIVDVPSNSDLLRPNDCLKTNENEQNSFNCATTTDVANRSKIIRSKKKRRGKRRRSSFKRNSLTTQDLDEEKMLRENALKSLKMKSTQNGLEPTPVTNSPSLELLTSSKILSAKPFSVEMEVAGGTSSDNFDEELDEDILRAQLLSSLTKKMSNDTAELPLHSLSLKKSIPKKQKRLRNISKRVWKNNISPSEIKLLKNEIKNNSNVNNYKLVKENRTNAPSVANVPPIPQVPKMIISLNDSDSSSDLEIDSPPKKLEEQITSSSKNPVSFDIEANIDLLLQEAQRQTFQEKFNAESSKSSDTVPGNPEDGDNERRRGLKNSALTVVHPPPPESYPHPHQSTPQALKHLPAWQQEEYRRLKKKIAEKEKVLQEVRGAKGMEIEEQLRAVGGDRAEPSTSANLSSAAAVPRSSPQPPGSSQSDSSTPKELPPLEPLSQLSPCLEVPPKPRAVSPSPAVQPPPGASLPSTASNFSSDAAKPSSNIASCSVLEEINLMNDIVNDFDKNSSEFGELKTKWTRLKKLLKLTEAKMLGKEKRLLSLKDDIQKKDRAICSKIDTLTAAQKPLAERNKALRRETELVMLKYKEVSLRAQFLFHDFSTQSKDLPALAPISSKKQDEKPPSRLHLPPGSSSKLPSGAPSLKRPRPPPLPESNSPGGRRKKLLQENSAPVEGTPENVKKSYSGKEGEFSDWDPNTPICHFDLNGICKDPECKFQHIKTV